MKYGVCFNLTSALRGGTLAEKLTEIAAAGFSFVETIAADSADLTDTEIDAITGCLKKNELECLTACVLFPGGIKLLGADATLDKADVHLDSLLPRAAKLGIKTLVFGSGGARTMPEGLSTADALAEFDAYAASVCRRAAEYGISIAIEHLNPSETNMLTTIADTLACVNRIDSDNCGLLFDFYHVDFQTDDMSNVPKAGKKLFHSHVAVPVTRAYPGEQDRAALLPYFETLKVAGYDGTVSIEARLDDTRIFAEQLIEAYGVLTS